MPVFNVPSRTKDYRQIRKEREEARKAQPPLPPVRQPGKLVEWTEVSRKWEDNCRTLLKQYPDAEDFMGAVRRHVCNKIRLKEARAWFMPGYTPSWLFRQDIRMERAKGPVECYMYADIIKTAAEECLEARSQGSLSVPRAVLHQLAAALASAKAMTSNGLGLTGDLIGDPPYIKFLQPDCRPRR